MTVSTAPEMPAVPSPPSRIYNYRNGSLLVGLSVSRSRRSVEVASSRLVVVEYTDPAIGPQLSHLADLGLIHTYDRRAANTADALVDYDEAMTQNRSFYVAGEVGLNATEFMVGDPSLYSNPVVNLFRPICIYVVQQNSLDGIQRRAVSEGIVVGGGGAAAMVPLIGWWVWLFLVLALIVLAAVVLLGVLWFWRWWRRRRGGSEKRCQRLKVYTAPSTSPGAVSPLAASYLDTLAKDRRRGRFSTRRAADLDACSDTVGDWSFAEPRPAYDSAGTPRRRRSRCVPVTELRSYFERRLSPDNWRALNDEFSLLPDGFTASVGVATRPANMPHNRTPDCVAYDHNRAQLASGLYINASVVHTIGRRQFVVTQFPTAETLVRFWQLVWERNIDVIVALVGVDEPDCEPYWPAELNQPATAVGGGFSVELVGVGVLAHFVLRELMLERHGEIGRRRVAHWQYTWWCADMSVACHPADFVEFIHRVREDDDYHDSGGVLVHCRSGGGRSGVYMAVDALLDQGTNTGVVDVVKCVSVLRTHRCGLVRSLEQYRFIYQCLCEQFDHPQTRFLAHNMPSQPRPGEFQLVFMPSYFDAVRSGDPLSTSAAVAFDSFIHRSAFLVSQGPQPLDAEGFWHVFTESGVSCVVSLGSLANIPGHELVVPRQAGSSISTYRYVVECKAVEKSFDSVYVTATLEVSAADGGRASTHTGRSVKLLELVSWPSAHSVPPGNALLRFTSLARCTQRRGTGPLLVFGTDDQSAGCRRQDRSRAAVFTALWRLMEQAELDAVVDVFSATRLACIQLPSALINEVCSPL